MAISIHVPSWGTTKNNEKALNIALFQSTFPRGERLAAALALAAASVFQSTFSRGERRCRIPMNIQLFAISIHVPSWGTTKVGE